MNELKQALITQAMKLVNSSDPNDLHLAFEIYTAIRRFESEIASDSSGRHRNRSESQSAVAGAEDVQRLTRQKTDRILHELQGVRACEWAHLRHAIDRNFSAQHPHLRLTNVESVRQNIELVFDLDQEAILTRKQSES